MSQVSNLVHQNMGVRENSVGKASRVRIVDKDGKKIKPDEIKILAKEIQEKFPDSMILIRGFNVMGQRTLKSGSGELRFDDEEQYFEGKVKNVGKFMEFTELHVTVTKFKKN